MRTIIHRGRGICIRGGLRRFRCREIIMCGRCASMWNGTRCGGRVGGPEESGIRCRGGGGRGGGGGGSVGGGEGGGGGRGKKPPDLFFPGGGRGGGVGGKRDGAGKGGGGGEEGGCSGLKSIR